MDTLHTVGGVSAALLVVIALVSGAFFLVMPIAVAAIHSKVRTLTKTTDSQRKSLDLHTGTLNRMSQQNAAQTAEMAKQTALLRQLLRAYGHEPEA